MPRGDKTGPRGKGPMTGRRLGRGGGNPEPGYGWGWGHGRCWGGGGPVWGPGFPCRWAPVDELPMLRNWEQALDHERKALRERIAYLERESKEDIDET